MSRSTLFFSATPRPRGYVIRIDCEEHVLQPRAYGVLLEMALAAAFPTDGVAALLAAECLTTDGDVFNLNQIAFVARQALGKHHAIIETVQGGYRLDVHREDIAFDAGVCRLPKLCPELRAKLQQCLEAIRNDANACPNHAGGTSQNR